MLLTFQANILDERNSTHVLDLYKELCKVLLRFRYSMWKQAFPVQLRRQNDLNPIYVPSTQLRYMGGMFTDTQYLPSNVKTSPKEVSMRSIRISRPMWRAGCAGITTCVTDQSGGMEPNCRMGVL